MKRELALFLLFVALLFIASCKKDKGRDYSSLSNLEQSTSLVYLDSAKAVALYNAVATERNTLLAKLENDYPGLKAQMDYDGKIITETNDSAQRVALIEDFNASYYNQVKQTWNNSGISLSAIKDKYTQILGNIPFTVGEFGQVSLMQEATVAEYRSPFPDDSVTVFEGTPVFNSDNNCGGIVISQNTQDEFTNRVRMFSTFAGGCWARNSGGAKVTVPGSSNYKYVHAKFQLYSSYMECIAWAIGAASVSSARLSLYIEKSSLAIPPVVRYVTSASATAPLIWYAQSTAEIPSGAEYEVALQTPQPLYGGEYRAFVRTENEISTGGAVSGVHSESNFVKYRTTLRMVK
jgi:hypothetical protein